MDNSNKMSQPLPPEMWEFIFCHLDVSSLKKVTETSKVFHEIVSGSEKLSKNLTLRLKYPQDMNSFAKCILKTKRKYRKLVVLKSRDRCADEFNQHKATQALQKLGLTVKELQIDWSNAQRRMDDQLVNLADVMRRRTQMANAVRGFNFNPFGAGQLNREAAALMENIRVDIHTEFLNVIRYFQNITKLTLINVNLETERQEALPEIQYQHLKELVLNHCDSYIFKLLSSVTHLEKIDVSDPWWTSRNPGIDDFELFLMLQKTLKHVDLKNFQFPRLFITDRSENISFKLESLKLNNVYFADKGILNQFLKTQTGLKTIDLQLRNEKIKVLDELQWYNNCLRTIITHSTHLHTITIAKIRYKINDYEFLSNTTNLSVKHLNFKLTSEDKSSELFKVLVRTFPNLQSINFEAEENEETDSGACFDDGTVLDHVESLVIKNSSVRSLANLQASSSLLNFEYVPGKTGEYIDDLFGCFFHRHRNIKNLAIGRNRGRSYFFVSYNLCQLIVNFLTHLESISIYNFGEVNKSVKLLCNLRKLRTLTLSTDDYQQFTAKTKVECARNDLKLIHINIPKHEPTFEPDNYVLLSI